MCVGVSLFKEEIEGQWGVGAGLVGTEGVGRLEEVLFEVSRVSLSPPFVSSFQMWGVEPGVSGLSSYLSREVH